MAPPFVNCAAVEAGFQFLAPAVFDFSTSESSLYSYSDGTSEFLQPNGYQPESFLGNTRCGIDSNGDGVLEPDPAVGQGELHLWGGPFREWGGGMGRSLQGYTTQSPVDPPGLPQLCPGLVSSPTAPPDDGTGPCPPLDPRVEAVAPGLIGTVDAGTSLRSDFYARVVDVRDWDGISFWARRGPGSDPGFRISLGDRQQDDDISFLETEAFFRTGGDAPGPSCGRVLECGCRNHRPCTADPGGRGSFCWDPELGDLAPSEILQPGDPVGTYPYDFPYESCGATQCDQPNDSFADRVDVPFATPANATPGTATCQPYTFQNDFTAEYCYDANDPNRFAVAPAYERCDDVWARPVALSEQWQLFKVPFTELRQEGWGKEFQYLDLSRIALVRFTWAVGWIDFWVDDVRFYRTTRPEAAN